MGDTVVPIKQFIQNEEQALFYFRGALLPKYRQALDELFLHAELLVAAMTMAEHLPRSEALLLAMLLGVGADHNELERRVAELEDRMDRSLLPQTGRS